MSHPGGYLRRARECVAKCTVFLLAATASLITADPINGQSAVDCRLKVEPVSGETGYKNRNGLCEGMYVALQSAPLNLQVVSYVTDRELTLQKDAVGQEGSVRLRPRTPESLSSEPVLLVGRTRQANLNWALDVEVRPSERDTGVTWDLKPVVWEKKLVDEDVLIGVYAQRPVTTSPFDDPVFVPVEVRVPGSGTEVLSDSLELVVRIPGASAVRWILPSDGPEGTRHQLKGIGQGLNADGFFRLLIPRTADEEMTRDTLAVYWRPRGRPGFHPVPELLQIYRE